MLSYECVMTTGMVCKKNTRLIDQKALLHPQIGADLLIDVPTEFSVQLPGEKRQRSSSEGDDAWQGNQGPLDLRKVCGREKMLTLECNGSLLDLVNLNGRVDQKTEVVDAQADDLNRVLASQRIVSKQHLVDEAEDEKGEVGGNGSGIISSIRRRSIRSLGVDFTLKLAEDESVQREQLLAKRKGRPEVVASGSE
jgi:hypothetical protein